MRHFGEFKGTDGFRLALDVDTIESVQESVEYEPGRCETIVFTGRNSHVIGNTFDEIQAIRTAASLRIDPTIGNDIREIAQLARDHIAALALTMSGTHTRGIRIQPRLQCLIDCYAPVISHTGSEEKTAFVEPDFYPTQEAAMDLATRLRADIQTLAFIALKFSRAHNHKRTLYASSEECLHFDRIINQYIAPSGIRSAEAGAPAPPSIPMQIANELRKDIGRLAYLVTVLTSDYPPPGLSEKEIDALQEEMKTLSESYYSPT